MKGTWVNPKTGHKFTVRDCYFENNQFMVQTTDGQILDYNTIQNYVQCTDKEGKDRSEELIHPNTQKDPLSGLREVETPIYEPEEPPMDSDTLIIDRVLGSKPLPALEITIKWTRFPKAQIDTLINTLDVSPEAIAKYYTDRTDLSGIPEETKAAVEAYLKSQLEQPKTNARQTTKPTKSNRSSTTK